MRRDNQYECKNTIKRNQKDKKTVNSRIKFKYAVVAVTTVFLLYHSKKFHCFTGA